MSKILKKYKTIPEHLYVERDADNQLKEIIEEMQSPGYVLVARQMGKTNLLFHARRTLQNKSRCFVYIDLSKTFEYERELYRDIIKKIISQNQDIFSEVKNEIQDIQMQELLANDEHIECLELLLNHFNGDIIIILDEIDALRTAIYSDTIFAFIRSIYFERTVSPFLERLTYILSGVIEPKDLIKDRNKSPFNIGEEIYLNDFSFSEHNLFIQKSKLDISKDNSDEIFLWTNGNPRLTFDICSDIESNMIDGLSIDKVFIKELIRKKYLVRFNIPPVDHIRELIKSNKPVRDAIANIQKGISNISDEMKQKLYLYGIINSRFDEKTMIKNQIIVKSLSLEWLKSFSDKSQITITYGLAQFTNKEYRKAVETFTEILDDTTITKEDEETSYYFLGKSYFFLRDFENSQKYLLYTFKDEVYKREAISFLGMCKLKSNFEEAVELLESVIAIETNDFAYHNALLNLAINLSEKENKRKYSLLQQLYDSTYKAEDIKENDLNKLRTVSLYYQFEIHNKLNETEKSIEKLQKAKRYANDSDSLYIIFLEYLLGRGEEELKQEIISKIIDKNIQFDIDQTYPISFNKNHLLHYLDIIFDTIDLFNKLIDYSIEFLFYKQKNKYELIYEVSRISTFNQEKYLDYLLNNKSEIDNTLHINTLRDISFIYSNNQKKFFKYFNQYLILFKEESVSLKSQDILLFARAVHQYADSFRVLEGLEMCKVLDAKTDKIEDKKLKFELLIINFWYASFYSQLRDKDNALKYATLTLERIANPLKDETSILDEKAMNSIKKQLNQIKDSFVERKPIRSAKKYRRNDKVKVKYLNEIIKEGKYKKFVADIKEKRCKII